MHANISDADRLDPVKATAYMLGEYQGAVARVPASVWANDPERAAETAVFLAERPAQDYYVARGADQVDSAWAKAKTGLAGGSVDSPATSGSHGGGGILSGVERGIGAVGGAVAGAVGGAASDAAGSAVSGILSPVVQELGKLLLIGGALVVGGGLIVGGLYKSVSKTAPVQAARQQAQTAATAAAVL
jgi:hypothetical protein